MDKLDPVIVRHYVEVINCTFDELSQLLTAANPGERGYSVRNLKRFCSLHNINKNNCMGTNEMDRLVNQVVHNVGPTVGRKMMQGALLSECGVKVSESKVRDSLIRVNPYNHRARQLGAEKQVNPTSYYAPFFGYNLHLDQNEKIERYGVVYVMAIDGCSGFITALSVMPIKNDITIYREVFLPSVLSYGLWDQLIVDQGREFYLTLWIQQCLGDKRIRQNRYSIKQVPSTKNNRVERIWVELNKRVTYPVKYALIDMEHRNLIDADVPHHRFSASVVCMQVCYHGAQQMIRMWNCHAIPEYGKPIDYIPSRQNSIIEQTSIPLADVARALYEQNGGHLTEERFVGKDLLAESLHLMAQRNNSFSSLLASLGGCPTIFSEVCNRNYIKLQHAIVRHIHLSELLFNNL